MSVCVGLLVVLICWHVSAGSNERDAASYDAGYRAGARAAGREQMIEKDVKSSVVCNILVARALARDGSATMTHRDFVNGCTRAVAEAME